MSALFNNLLANKSSFTIKYFKRLTGLPLSGLPLFFIDSENVQLWGAEQTALEADIKPLVA